MKIPIEKFPTPDCIVFVTGHSDISPKVLANVEDLRTIIYPVPPEMKLKTILLSDINHCAYMVLDDVVENVKLNFMNIPMNSRPEDILDTLNGIYKKNLISNSNNKRNFKDSKGFISANYKEFINRTWDFYTKDKHIDGSILLLKPKPKKTTGSVVENNNFNSEEETVYFNSEEEKEEEANELIPLYEEEIQNGNFKLNKDDLLYYLNKAGYKNVLLVDFGCSKINDLPTEKVEEFVELLKLQGIF